MDVPPPTPINRTQNNTMPLTSAGLWWRVVAHFKLTRNHSQFARPTARGTHLESAGRQCREHGEGGGGRGGEGKVSATWHSHTHKHERAPIMPHPTATTSHNAHSHRTCSHAEAMACTVGSGGSRGVRRSGRATSANRPHKPTAHTYQHNTEQHHVAHLRGPRVARGRPLQADCYLVLLTRSTTGCTHLRSGGGAENRESGRGEGDKGHGVSAAAGHRHNTQTGLHNAPPYSRHFPHRTQPLHMQSRTGDSLHRAQGEGRGAWRLGRATAHTDTNNTMALTCGGPGWRVVARYKLTCYHAHFARSTAGCTHNWSPQGDNVGNRERGGGGSQGDCECDTQKHAAAALHPTVAASRTAHSYHTCSHAQVIACTGHRDDGRREGRLGRATAHTDQHNNTEQHHGAHLRGPRVACGRPLQVDLLPRALHTIHCWMHTHLESAGRQRGEQGEGGSQGDCECDTHTNTGGRNAPPPQPLLPTPHTIHAVTHR